MAVNRANEDYLLPCGRDVEQVWQRLDEIEAGRADAHELDCPYCRATRESLTMLRGLAQELVEETEEPSLDVTGRIMAAVRAEVRRHDLLPLPTPEPGGVRVSARAVAAVLRFAADGVHGVRARHCRVSTTDADDLVMTVEMSVAVSYRGFALHALDEVRARVAAAAEAQIGVRLERLDLILDDLYDA
jgi:hypothetical protein